MLAKMSRSPSQGLASSPDFAVDCMLDRPLAVGNGVNRLFEKTGRLHQLVLDRFKRFARGWNQAQRIPAIHFGHMPQHRKPRRSLPDRSLIELVQQVGKD